MALDTSGHPYKWREAIVDQPGKWNEEGTDGAYIFWRDRPIKIWESSGGWKDATLISEVIPETVEEVTEFEEYLKQNPMKGAGGIADARQMLELIKAKRANKTTN